MKWNNVMHSLVVNDFPSTHELHLVHLSSKSNLNRKHTICISNSSLARPRLAFGPRAFSAVQREIKMVRGTNDPWVGEDVLDVAQLKRVRSVGTKWLDCVCFVRSGCCRGI